MQFAPAEVFVRQNPVKFTNPLIKAESGQTRSEPPAVGFWREDQMLNTPPLPEGMAIIPAGTPSAATGLVGQVMLMKSWPVHLGFIKVGIETEAGLPVENPIRGFLKKKYQTS